MAYGQTGSGKTHTIFGSQKAVDYFTQSAVHEDSGIATRTVSQIFNYIHEVIARIDF
jgi:hypothetical protein